LNNQLRREDGIHEKSNTKEAVSIIGLDPAKNVFQVHGVDETGAVVLRKQLRRSGVLKYFAQLSPCLIGMEACGGAHYWSRELSRLGHDVRIIAPAFVKPYLKANKNDRNDAEAICEAVQRPSMRFVYRPRHQHNSRCCTCIMDVNCWCGSVLH